MPRSDVCQLKDFARFYDFSYAGMDLDVPFYIDLVRKHGSPVLEAACGTGRVTIPLARQGFRAVGIDFSEHMLQIARTKLERERAQVRKLVSFHLGDMRSFNLGERFPVVLVPNASVFHLDNEESLLECFSCLYTHALNGGVVVVDAVSPQLMANQAVDEEVLVGRGINPFTGLGTRELNRTLLIDRQRRVVRVEHVYVEEQDDPEKRFVFQQDYRWVEKEEGLDLLRRAGFVDLAAFGDYAGSAYSPDSPRLILTGRRIDDPP